MDSAVLKQRLDRISAGNTAGRPRLGARAEYHETIGSTNDRARALAASGEPEGTVVVAGEQSRGRGRASRSWHSKAGLGVYLSVILRPVAPAAAVPVFGLLAANAVVDALRALGIADAVIDWPNDILAGGSGGGAPRKIAGILTEARTSGDGIGDLVVGVGLNVNHEAADFPGDLIRSSTSMGAIKGRRYDRLDVIAAVVRALGDWYERWHEDGSVRVLAGYRERAEGLAGRRVMVGEGPGRWTGLTAGLAPDGALRILRDAADGRPGAMIEIRQGDFIRIEEAG